MVTSESMSPAHASVLILDPCPVAPSSSLLEYRQVSPSEHAKAKLQELLTVCPVHTDGDPVRPFAQAQSVGVCLESSSSYLQVLWSLPLKTTWNPGSVRMHSQLPTTCVVCFCFLFL